MNCFQKNKLLSVFWTGFFSSFFSVGFRFKLLDFELPSEFREKNEIEKSSTLKTMMMNPWMRMTETKMLKMIVRLRY